MIVLKLPDESLDLRHRGSIDAFVHIPADIGSASKWPKVGGEGAPGVAKVFA